MLKEIPHVGCKKMGLNSQVAFRDLPKSQDPKI